MPVFAVLEVETSYLVSDRSPLFGFAGSAPGSFANAVTARIKRIYRIAQKESSGVYSTFPFSVSVRKMRKPENARP
jgi:hypothetical protein